MSRVRSLFAWPDARSNGERVSTNKRCADAIDRRMNARISEREAEGHAPLTTDELELATEPLTKTPVPAPCGRG